jgi:hypothetical protein
MPKGAKECVCLEGRITVRRGKVVLVGVGGNLHIVLVCETEEGHQHVDITGGRVGDRVDDSEE